MLRARVQDDAGRSWPVFPLRRAGLFRDSGRGPAAPRGGLLRREAIASVLGFETLPVVLTLAVVAALVVVLVYFGGRPFGLVFHTPAIIAGLSVLLVLAQGWAAGRASFVRRVRRTMLALSRCPSCGYGLRCEPDDPLTACAECGSIWRTEAVGLMPGEYPPPKVVRADWETGVTSESASAD